MKILIATPECVPFIKTGGLADVSGALAKILKKNGHDVRLILPRYKKINEKTFGLKQIFDNLNIPIGDKIKKATIKLSTQVDKIPVYFIDNEYYFGREELYRTALGDYEDNAERFIFFTRATLEALKVIDFKPDIIHGHDWQVALLNVYLKTLYKYDAFFGQTASVFTIHNLAYQGLYPKETVLLAGIGWEEFIPDKLEYWGQLNILKGGIVYSDIVSTVSETYAEEIQGEEYGRGLDGVLCNRKQDLYGIVNGIDYEEWNPKTDKLISVNYDVKNIAQKEECKKVLLQSLNLPYQAKVPVVGIVSRLDPQKGFDILAESIEEMMTLNLYFILLGKGDQIYQDLFASIGTKYPKKCGISISFNNELAHRIYAGSDMFLMPSHFEPCGLGQLISLKYGTIPIVRLTGGLADTISEFNPESGRGNGFVFKEYTSGALISTIKRALSIYQKPKIWRQLQTKAMKADFSWNKATQSYLELYKKALAKRQVEAA